MKTAMQELIEYFNERPEYDKTSEGYEIIEKAKQLLEKEKEQIMKAVEDTRGNIVPRMFISENLSGEQYYNQSYNN